MRADLMALKKMFDSGENIIAYLKESTGKKSLNTDLIAISYDFQAGNYIKKARELKDYENERAEVYSEIINCLGEFDSILEAGIGEATTFANVLPRLSANFQHSFGFDVSYSRIMYANKHLRETGNLLFNNCKTFMADLFNAPLQDNSIDVVYTNHTLEPNGGLELEAINELYRVTNKYLVFFEPIYELGNSKAKKHIDQHGYVKNIYNICKKLKLNVSEYKLLFEGNALSPNNTGVLVIRKPNSYANSPATKFACPVTKKKLKVTSEHFYCEDSMLLYPIVCGIPCLLPNNAIIATHFLDNLP
jgi:ubiquinone/menaquinone biosynthesis C-methylase UbiE